MGIGSWRRSGRGALSNSVVDTAMSEGDSPEQYRARFKWLHGEGALSDDELRQRLAAVDALDTAKLGYVGAEPGIKLN